MFTHKTIIYLRNTDATGVLYFAEKFTLALQVFEEYLKVKKSSLKNLLKEEYLLPIVHAEADYFSSLRAGDEVEITLQVAHIGNTSFKLEYALFLIPERTCVGKVSLVHVCTSKETGRSIPIPAPLLSFLHELQHVV